MELFMKHATGSLEPASAGAKTMASNPVAPTTSSAAFAAKLVEVECDEAALDDS
jgi:hypothetical protein